MENIQSYYDYLIRRNPNNVIKEAIIVYNIFEGNTRDPKAIRKIKTSFESREALCKYVAEQMAIIDSQPEIIYNDGNCIIYR